MYISHDRRNYSHTLRTEEHWGTTRFGSGSPWDRVVTNWQANEQQYCAVSIAGKVGYELSCVKGKMLNVLKEEVANAKSAHVDGW